MVCSSAKMGTSSATGSKIAGGFVLVSVAALMTAWRACQARPLGIGDFRAWLACHELQARRCIAVDDRAPSYSYTELARLLDVTDRRAQGLRATARGRRPDRVVRLGYRVPGRARTNRGG